MVRAMMYHVAALAKAFEIAQPVIGRVMIKVCRRQDDGMTRVRRIWADCSRSGHRVGRPRPLRQV